MAKILAIGAMLAGIGSIASGGACLIQHFAAGDVMDHLKECLALFTAGIAMFSPGLNSLKTGIFARPGATT